MHITQINIVTAILLLICFLLAIVALYFLLGNNKKYKGSKIIGLYFLNFFIVYFFGNLLQSNILLGKKEIFNSIYILIIIDFLNLSLVPTFYIYVKANLIKDYRFKEGEFIHFIPLLVASIGVLAYVWNPTMYRESLSLIFSLIGISFEIFYFYLPFRLLKKYKAKVYENFSSLSQYNYKWIEFIIYATVISYAIMLPLWFIHRFFLNKDYMEVFLTGVAFIPLIYMSLVLWKILLNSDSTEPILEAEIKTKPKPKPKYATSTLAENEKKEHLSLLQQFMTLEQVFLNPDINLKTVANQLNIPPRILSQIINEKLNQNFYDFINSYRIEHAKHLLKNPVDDRMTISQVLYASGFNSKSSFNTAFKKFTGITPSQYKNTLK